MRKNDYQLHFNQYEMELLREQTFANKEKIDYPRYYRNHHHYLLNKAIVMSNDYTPSIRNYRFRLAEDYIKEMIKICKESK